LFVGLTLNIGVFNLCLSWDTFENTLVQKIREELRAIYLQFFKKHVTILWFHLHKIYDLAINFIKIAEL
jgi:hypothetical protein